MSDYYYCSECGELFEKSEAGGRAEDPSPRGVSLASGYYLTDVCPWCGSDELIEANECVLCGDPIKPTTRFCRDCMDYMEPLMDIIENYLGRRKKTREDDAYIIDEAYMERGH